ncbi:isocitrate/isopropylmalate family dehydrogenase [Kutzneria sp. CA-103260]|uniref:isocitrate/isopropylmalate family dehydrogenase n=1 Tax=Kutzneria sp. CA-103260 TaxID=2802641 RepID=UPI001BEE5510|nr:isocitrate/isopropylmalate family dehydrogenase [Kutzneria sp. CA-103260]QUQ66640.1 3-isopropylmalate dehydrogenase [Kutzneria sp. CA-103260]
MEPIIGLAVGRGTGPELAEVFERVLGGIGRLHGREIAIRRSPRAYHSYFTLEPTGDTERLTRQDAQHYEGFCRELAGGGVTAVFRTAINAQSLYLVRERLWTVKVDAIGPLLLVRDQAQGFYTGSNAHADGVVERTMVFRRDLTEQVIDFALRAAERHWPGQGPARIVMAYKFHLLDGVFGRWVAEIAARRGVRITLCQPDTANRNLVEHGFGPRTLLIAGNEWADIMHVMLLDRFGRHRQENRCAENHYLHPEVAGLVEYQTVHGSADDLAGRDEVNPTATVRAAAAIAERHAGCPGAVGMVERVLESLRDNSIGTRDVGGRHGTSAVVDALLEALAVQPVAGP